MLKFFKRPIHLGLMRNAINAKLTLSQFEPEEKLQVYGVANALYVSNGKITNLESALQKVRQNMPQLDLAFSRMSEVEKCVLYSLAMMEIGIEPVLVGEGWQIPPSNPFSYLAGFDEVDHSTAISYFRDKHRITVTMVIHVG